MKQLEKYFISSNILLYNLFFTGCIYCDDLTLMLDYDKQKFDNLLDKLFKDLQFIEKLYLDSKSPEDLINTENKFLENMREIVNPNVEKILSIIKE